MSDKSMPNSAMIGILQKVFFKQIKKEVSDLNINSTYAEIIMILCHHKDQELSQNDVCDIIHLAKPTLSLTVKNMEQEGLIIRTPSKDDSRKIILSITDKGLSLDNKIRECFKKVEEMMINDIDDNDIKVFQNVVDKMIINLKGDKNA